MTNQEILTKAVQKAIDGGWHGIYKDGHTWPEAKDLLRWKWEPDTEKLSDDSYEDETTINIEAIIFNHDFAKAIWGEEQRDSWTESKAKGVTIKTNNPGMAYTVKKHGWQHHLQQMVVAEDPIKYLGEHLDD
jgi:hypothetical protein